MIVLKNIYPGQAYGLVTSDLQNQECPAIYFVKKNLFFLNTYLAGIIT